MGTLRTTEIIEPGTVSVNGVLLGEPLELDGDPNTYDYDDSAFPNGTFVVVDGEAIITLDEEPEPAPVLEEETE